MRIQISSQIIETLEMNYSSEQAQMILDKFIVPKISEYVDRFRKEGIGKKDLPKLYQEFDEVIEDGKNEFLQNGVKLSCRKKCSYCCYQAVDLFDMEFELYADMYKSGKILINIEQLKKSENHHTVDDFIKEPLACVFLKDGLCSIYDVRPISCRKYYVSNDPVHCDMNDRSVRNLSLPTNVRIEILYSAMATYFGKRRYILNQYLLKLFGK